MVTMRLYFEYHDPDHAFSGDDLHYDEADFTLPDGTNTEMTIELMNLWTEFVAENKLKNTIITDMDEVLE